MSADFELETETALSNGEKYKVKINHLGAVTITLKDHPTNPDVTFNWTIGDLRMVNSANQPLVVTYTTLKEQLG